MTTTLEQVIAESNDEMEIWSSVTVWRNSNNELMVRLEFTDSDDPERNYQLSAIIDRDEIKSLASSLGTAPDSLPSVLFGHFGTTSNCMVPSEVEVLFQEILNFILDNGARYRLNRE